MTKRKTSTRTDGTATKGRIIESASKLFANFGFAETTNKAIAADAQVDLASINYHFGSRAGLYQAVLIEAHREFINIDELAKIQAQDISAEDKLHAVITLFCNPHIEDKKWYAQLLAREVAAPSSYFEVLFTQEVTPKMNIVRNIVSAVAHIDADLPQIYPCLINIFAPCLMYMLQKNNNQIPLFQISRSDFIKHHYQFTIAGLKAIGA